MQLLQTIRAHSEPVEQLLIVPETGFLVTCSADRTVKVWQYGEQRLIKKWAHPDSIRSLGLLRRLRKIVCGTEQCHIVLFPLDEVPARRACVASRRVACTLIPPPRRRRRRRPDAWPPRTLRGRR